MGKIVELKNKNEDLQNEQINELTQFMFELRNGRDDDFDGLLDLKDALEQAVADGDVSMIEVGNALSSAKAGNTALADEIRDRIDDRFQENQKETEAEYGE